MAQQQYKVVEARWVGGERVESDIGQPPQTERKAKETLRQLKQESPGRTFSLQKIK